MKTIEINLYKFDELSEYAKERAITNAYDINTDYEWWEYVYQDAENIGLQITSFDAYYQTITANFINNADYTASAIINEHGETCDTYKLAVEYKQARELILTNIQEQEGNENSFVYELEGDLDFLNEQFLIVLKADYISTLKKEYEYLTSKEQIIETLIANDYDFTEDGEIY